MVFEGSDVPLEEDILKIKREFITTWLDWAAQNLERVSQTVAGLATIFTVPENKTLYITTSWISWSSEASGATTNSNFAIVLSAAAAINTILQSRKPAVNGIHGGEATCYPMPIKVESNQTVLLVGGLAAADAVTSGFTGFLVDKRIS